MQPLDLNLRRALLDAHEGLTEARIDRLQDLLVLRFSLDAERESERVRAIDREVAELIAEEMPRYGEVLDVLSGRRHG